MRMKQKTIKGISGATYTYYEAPQFVGYWDMNGIMKQPSDVKPSWYRRIMNRALLGWTWHDGMDGL